MRHDRATMRTRTARLCSALSIMLLLAVLPACGGGYALRGRVIEGDFSHIQFVSKDDPRLATEAGGVDGAQMLVYRDPSSLGRKLAAQCNSDMNGMISCTIGEFGAGWLVEDWEIVVNRPQYANATRLGQIPRNSKNMRVLIILARGDSTAIPSRSPYQDDLNRFGR